MSFPRMSLHIGDYKRKTSHLKGLGHGAYLLLIMHYWSTGGLPDNDDELSAITCTTKAEWKKLKPTMKAFFEDGWRHERIDEEIAKAQASYERRVAAGKKGGDAKASHKQSSSNATAEPKQPITSNRLRDDQDEDAREAVENENGKAPKLISDSAFRISGEIAKICGYSEPIDWPLGWSQAHYRVQTWLSAGWTEDQILPACQSAMAGKRDGPPSTINYFDKPIAQWIARQAKPLPEVKIQERETISVVRSNGNSVIAAADRLVENIAKWERGDVLPDVRGRAGADDVRLLSSK